MAKKATKKTAKKASKKTAKSAAKKTAKRKQTTKVRFASRSSG